MSSFFQSIISFYSYLSVCQNVKNQAIQNFTFLVNNNIGLKIAKKLAKNKFKKLTVKIVNRDISFGQSVKKYKLVKAVTKEYLGRILSETTTKLHHFLKENNSVFDRYLLYQIVWFVEVCRYSNDKRLKIERSVFDIDTAVNNCQAGNTRYNDAVEKRCSFNESSSNSTSLIYETFGKRLNNNNPRETSEEPVFDSGDSGIDVSSVPFSNFKNRYDDCISDAVFSNTEKRNTAGCYVRSTSWNCEPTQLDWKNVLRKVSSEPTLNYGSGCSGMFDKQNLNCVTKFPDFDNEPTSNSVKGYPNRINTSYEQAENLHELLNCSSTILESWFEQRSENCPNSTVNDLFDSTRDHNGHVQEPLNELFDSTRDHNGHVQEPLNELFDVTHEEFVNERSRSYPTYLNGNFQIGYHVFNVQAIQTYPTSAYFSGSSNSLPVGSCFYDASSAEKIEKPGSLTCMEKQRFHDIQPAIAMITMNHGITDERTGLAHGLKDQWQNQSNVDNEYDSVVEENEDKNVVDTTEHVSARESSVLEIGKHSSNEEYPNESSFNNNTIENYDNGIVLNNNEVVHGNHMPTADSNNERDSYTNHYITYSQTNVPPASVALLDSQTHVISLNTHTQPSPDTLSETEIDFFKNFEIYRIKSFNASKRLNNQDALVVDLAKDGYYYLHPYVVCFACGIRFVEDNVVSEKKYPHNVNCNKEATNVRLRDLSQGLNYQVLIEFYKRNSGLISLLSENMERQFGNFENNNTADELSWDFETANYSTSEQSRQNSETTYSKCNTLNQPPKLTTANSAYNFPKQLERHIRAVDSTSSAVNDSVRTQLGSNNKLTNQNLNSGATIMPCSAATATTTKGATDARYNHRKNSLSLNQNGASYNADISENDGCYILTSKSIIPRKAGDISHDIATHNEDVTIARAMGLNHLSLDQFPADSGAHANPQTIQPFTQQKQSPQSCGSLANSQVAKHEDYLNFDVAREVAAYGWSTEQITAAVKYIKEVFGDISLDVELLRDVLTNLNTADNHGHRQVNGHTTGANESTIVESNNSPTETHDGHIGSHETGCVGSGGRENSIMDETECAPITDITTTVEKQAVVVNNNFTEMYQSVEREHTLLKRRVTCSLCLAKQIDTIYMPCGHVIACHECADMAVRCLFCNKLIIGTANVFLC